MQLSYTKLRTFGECRLKYRMAYIERLPRPPLRALAFGRQLHAALGQYHLFSKRDGTVRLDELLGAFDEVMGAHEDPGIRERTAYKEGAEILRRYHAREQVSTRVPAYLERTLKAPFGPHVLVGTVDRLDFTERGGYSLIDYKLDRELPEGNAAAGSRQLSFYHLLVYEALGVAPEDLRLYYLRHGVEQVSTRSRAQMDETADWVSETAAAVRSERSWSACEGASCRVCAFRAQCPAKTGIERELPTIWRQADLVGLFPYSLDGREESAERAASSIAEGQVAAPAQMALDLDAA